MHFDCISAFDRPAAEARCGPRVARIEWLSRRVDRLRIWLQALGHAGLMQSSCIKDGEYLPRSVRAERLPDHR